MDELNTLAAELSSALSVFADLRVSASVILLALIVWLVWTASSHVRHRGAQLDSVEDDADPRHAASSPPAASPSDDLSSPKRQEGTAVPTMTQGSSVHTTAAALRERAGTVAATARDQVSATTQRWSEKAPRPQVAGVTVRRSRLALATLVALCALVFVVTGVAAAFGANTVAVAGWTLLGTVAGLGLLRGLALLDARARRREAERLRAEEAEAHRAPAHIARGARAATAGVHAEHQPAVLIDSADVARVRLTAPAV
ncbi:MAG: hypothetical protein Q4G34_02235, partial [Micrococcus sp.]|nr:hypothetical protein [Micrococcus sp.]